MQDAAIAPQEINPPSGGDGRELGVATKIQSPRPSESQAHYSGRDQRVPTRIRKILVPTDFSPASTVAVKRAVALANQCGATLTILHIIDINPQGAGTADNLMKGLWSEASAEMGRLAWSLCGQVEAQTMLQEGLPWEEIVEKSKDFDLVIVGKSRANKRWKLFSKHTAECVAENAACPVMVVQAEA